MTATAGGGRMGMSNTGKWERADPDEFSTDLSASDVEAIVTLTKQGISVNRSITHGDGYTCIMWSFLPDDDDDDEGIENAPIGDDYMAYLQDRQER